VVVPVEAERVVAAGITAVCVLIGGEVVVVPVEAERVYRRSCGDRDGEAVVVPVETERVATVGVTAVRVVVPVETERVVAVGVTAVCVMIGGEVRWWWCQSKWRGW